MIERGTHVDWPNQLVSEFVYAHVLLANRLMKLKLANGVLLLPFLSFGEPLTYLVPSIKLENVWEQLFKVVNHANRWLESVSCHL